MNAPEIPEITPEEMPAKTIANLMAVVSAVAYGKKVSADRMRARLAVCLTCDRVRKDGEKFRCGICGCKLSAPKGIADVRKRDLINLVLYEETPMYSCKHHEGSKWKKAGV